MAIHWQIRFKSLRTQTDYRVNIYDANYSGNPIQLNGGAEPFTTEEDGSDDMFTPIRKQNGHIRIVDNGKDANGNSLGADWWKSLVPLTDKDRPVTLTDGNNNIVWQGFMQAQNFSGELYEAVQEREFPIQCCLSVLSSIQTPTTIQEPKNFAYLLKTCLDSIPQHSFTNIVVQGGTDARYWLLKMFDWRNLLDIDENDEYKSRYNLAQNLEDMCAYWGWTARTQGQTVYLMCADDPNELAILTLTASELATMAAGTSAGTPTGVFSTTTISGDVFANTDNEDIRMRGVNKCVVKADCNRQDSVVSFAPEVVRKQMENVTPGYTWVNQPNEEMGIGYYTTGRLASFDVSTMWGSCTANGGFYRRQVYSDLDTDRPNTMDIIAVSGRPDYTPTDGVVFLQSKNKMMFSGGSLTISGSVLKGAKMMEGDKFSFVRMRIGIGQSRTYARWFYLTTNGYSTISHGWSNDQEFCDINYQNGNMRGWKVYWLGSQETWDLAYKTIPCDATGLYGYLFIDIIGCYSANREDDDGGDTGWRASFEVGNLEIKYSRDQVFIPTSVNAPRQREVYVERVSSREYSAENGNNVNDVQNVDCIFASDNNMEYGYGLIINPDNSYMDKAPYTQNTGATYEYPEQHLANRVSNYSATSKRMINGAFRANTIADITPRYKVRIDSTWLYPVAISRNWRDDIVKLSLLQI